MGTEEPLQKKAILKSHVKILGEKKTPSKRGP